MAAIVIYLPYAELILINSHAEFYMCMMGLKNSTPRLGQSASKRASATANLELQGGTKPEQALAGVIGFKFVSSQQRQGAIVGEGIVEA